MIFACECYLEYGYSSYIKKIIWGEAYFLTLIGYWTKIDVGFNWFDVNSEWIYYVVL